MSHWSRIFGTKTVAEKDSRHLSRNYAKHQLVHSFNLKELPHFNEKCMFLVLEMKVIYNIELDEAWTKSKYEYKNILR